MYPWTRQCFQSCLSVILSTGSWGMWLLPMTHWWSPYSDPLPCPGPSPFQQTWDLIVQGSPGPCPSQTWGPTVQGPSIHIMKHVWLASGALRILVECFLVGYIFHFLHSIPPRFLKFRSGAVQNHPA